VSCRVSDRATRAYHRECIEAIAETADKEWNFYFKLKPKEEMYKRNITFDEGDRKRAEILLARFAYRNTTASTASKEKALAQDDAPVPNHHTHITAALFDWLVLNNMLTICSVMCVRCVRLGTTGERGDGQRKGGPGCGVAAGIGSRRPRTEGLHQTRYPHTTPHDTRTTPHDTR
jgi:hypothetical protein